MRGKKKKREDGWDESGLISQQLLNQSRNQENGLCLRGSEIDIVMSLDAKEAQAGGEKILLIFYDSFFKKWF